MSSPNTEFPYSLTISIPLPTHRLASVALRALQVDAELSPLVRRNLSLEEPDLLPPLPAGQVPNVQNPSDAVASGKLESNSHDLLTVLRIEYKATTNRMLRVAVNAFMESLGVVLGVMEELDVDVLAANTAGQV